MWGSCSVHLRCTKSSIGWTFKFLCDFLKPDFTRLLLRLSVFTWTCWHWSFCVRFVGTCEHAEEQHLCFVAWVTPQPLQMLHLQLSGWVASGWGSSALELEKQKHLLKSPQICLLPGEVGKWGAEPWYFSFTGGGFVHSADKLFLCAFHTWFSGFCTVLYVCFCFSSNCFKPLLVFVLLLALLLSRFLLILYL